MCFGQLIVREELLHEVRFGDCPTLAVEAVRQPASSAAAVWFGQERLKAQKRACDCVKRYSAELQYVLQIKCFNFKKLLIVMLYLLQFTVLIRYNGSGGV